MNNLIKLRRPAVLIALFAIIEILLAVLFFKYIHIILISSVILGIVFSLTLFKKDKTIAFICAVMIVLPAINTAISYNSKLIPAKKLVKQQENNSETVFTANVYDHRSHGSYNASFVKITHIDHKKLSSGINAKVSSYGTSYIENGTIIDFTGTPTYIADIANDEYNSSLYLFGKGIFLEFENANLVDAHKGKSIDVFSFLRSITKDVIYKYVQGTDGNDKASVSYAIFAGDSEYIDDDVQTAFHKSGTLHILCVSGMHLVILCSFITSLLTALTVSKRNRCLIIVAFCIFYTIFTGFSLSTLRASIMCILSYFGMVYGKKSDSYISLFLSLYIIILINPFSLFDISLILSFFATLGLIVTSVAVPKFDKTSIPKHIISSILSALLCGIGAACFTLPFCAFFFDNISIYQVISTLIMSPPSEFLLSALFCLVILSPLSFTALGNIVLLPIGYVCMLLSGLIIKIADFFASLEYSSIYGWNTKFFLILFSIIFVLITLCISFGKTKILKTLVIIVISICTVQIAVSAYHNIQDDLLYKVQYFRQNENDRQLSIKLGRDGYFLVNADNRICEDQNLCYFDEEGNNYLLIIPDHNINPAILATNIKRFNKNFGLKRVYISRNTDGELLFDELTHYGIECMFMPSHLRFNSINIKYTYADYHSVFIDDSNTSANIIFAEKYDKDYFYAYADINAFFTRKTENQFDTKTDSLPDGSKFYTRLKKNQAHIDTVNTFGQKSILIKG